MATTWETFTLAVQNIVVRGGIVNIDLTVDQFNQHESELERILKQYPGHAILLAHIDGPEQETAILFDFPTATGHRSDIPSAPVTMFLIPSDRVEDALKTFAQAVSQIGSS